MIVGNMILLEDDKKYLLLDETTLDNIKYFYAVQLNDEDFKPTENYKFLKQTNDEKSFYVTEVTDQETLSSLLIIFTNNLGLTIDKMTNQN